MSFKIVTKPVISFFVLLFIGRASGLEIYRPPYLIKHQPMPYTLKVSGSYGISSSLFNLGMDGTPIPVVSKRDLIVLGGLGVFYDKVKQEPDYDLQGESVSLFGSGLIGEKLFWISYHFLGSYTTEKFDIHKNSLLYGTMAVVGYKIRSWFCIGAGVYYSTGFSEPEFLPLPFVSIANKRFCFSILPPGNIEVRTEINRRLALNLRFKYVSNAFSERGRDIVTYSYLMPYTGIEIRLGRYLKWEIGVNYKAFRELSFRESGKNEGLHSMPGFETGLLLIID